MNKQKILITIAFAGVVFVATPVFAEVATADTANQTEATQPLVSEKNGEKATSIHKIKKEVNKKITNKREGGSLVPSARARDEKQAREKEILANRQEENMASSTKKGEILREELKRRFEANKEELTTKLEKEKTRLTKALKVIKDERRKNTVEQISAQFQDINTKRLEHFSSVLDQMDGVLAKIKSRAEKIAGSGADTSALNAEIATFETAVTTARAAIVVQSSKVYSINVTTDKNLKNDVGVTRQALQGDLKIVFGLVKSAHDSLKNVVQELAKFHNAGDQEQSSVSSSATTSRNQ